MQFCYRLSGNHVRKFLNGSFSKFVKVCKILAVHCACYIQRRFSCHIKKNTAFHVAGKSDKSGNAHNGHGSGFKVNLPTFHIGIQHLFKNTKSSLYKGVDVFNSHNSLLIFFMQNAKMPKQDHPPLTAK